MALFLFLKTEAGQSGETSPSTVFLTASALVGAGTTQKLYFALISAGIVLGNKTQRKA